MLDAWRHHLAASAARRAVRDRRAPTPGARLEGRRLLVVLPAVADREIWAFLARVALPPTQLHLVALGACSPPDRFAGAVEVVGDTERDWRGLPRRAVAGRAWAFRPDVAIAFGAPDDVGAVLLVGAAPASVRVARHEASSEGAYDLLVVGGPGEGLDPARLARLLARLDPPLIPLRG